MRADAGLAWAKARFGGRVLTDIRPLRDRRLDERGGCSVCGTETTFAFNSWVTPGAQRATWDDPDAWMAHTRRESMFCRSCYSSLRVRRFAEVLLQLYGNGAASNAAELVEQEDFRGLDVAEINAIGSVGSLHRFLQRLPRLWFSEYRGPGDLGQIVAGARNEDICSLTYPDASVDLVLSSDTLEHVPDFMLALRETRRVLRPGGRHIFTVPIIASRPTTVARATVGDAGRIVHHLPPVYHGRGSGLYRLLPVGTDLLAYTEFGADLCDHIAAAGFEPELFRGDDVTGMNWVFSGRVVG
jgi:SAM-dependent methyltransferase